jgi:metal-responsive CopG/Arc/MetJ family transcriptional regulator
MKRLNITLPERVAEAIEVYQNKSKFIAEAINEKIEKDKKEKLDILLVEGYKIECSADKKINKEWKIATLEGWPDR